jgi:hypothetical protein
VNYYEGLKSLEKKRIATEKKEEEEGLKLYQNVVSKQQSSTEISATKSLSLFSLGQKEKVFTSDKKKHKRDKIQESLGSKRIKIDQDTSIEMQKLRKVESNVKNNTGLNSLLGYGDEDE